MNQELIKRLAAGEIAYKHTGTNQQGLEIIKKAFPKKNYKWSMATLTKDFYRRSFKTKQPFIGVNDVLDVEIFTTEQFFEPETNHVPDVRKTMDKETRELAKQLFVAKMYAGNLPSANAMNQSIDNAKQFIQLLNNE